MGQGVATPGQLGEPLHRQPPGIIRYSRPVTDYRFPSSLLGLIIVVFKARSEKIILELPFLFFFISHPFLPLFIVKYTITADKSINIHVCCSR